MPLIPEDGGASTQIRLFAHPYAAGVILSHLPPPPPSPSVGTKPCPDNPVADSLQPSSVLQRGWRAMASRAAAVLEPP